MSVGVRLSIEFNERTYKDISTIVLYLLLDEILPREKRMTFQTKIISEKMKSHKLLYCFPSKFTGRYRELLREA